MNRRGEPRPFCTPVHPALATLLLLIAGLLTPLASAGPPTPATDADIRGMLDKAGNAEDYGKASTVLVLDEADVHVQHSGLATTESCQVIKILTDAGIKSHSILRREYDPDTYRMAIRQVKIHRAGGSVNEVPLEGLVFQPTKQSMIYWGGEQVLLGIPNLNVGDALEIRMAKIGFNIAYLAPGDGVGGGLDGTGLQPPMDGHWFEVTEFQGSQPIISKRYSVHMPADMPIQFEVYNGELRSSLWFNGETHVYTFTAEDVPAVKREPNMVATSDCVPKLVMATLEDWESKSRWFFHVNDGQFDADDAIRATVAEITEGLDEEEAIQACLHWVADNIRYYGTSRGPCEGFTLHTGIETYHDKGGVCKDIAGMLVTMLRVLGHDANPALTMAGSRVEDIPADQFNHTVTVMRSDDGTFRILDPTWSPISRELWSSREALQGLVYGTPEGESLTLSPYYTPEYNTLRCRAESTLAPNGDLQSNMRFDVSGYPGTSLRRYSVRDPKPDQQARFEQYLNLGPTATIVEMNHINARDYSQDGWLEMTIAAPRYAAAGEAVQQFDLPLLRNPLEYIFLRDFSYDFSAEERQHMMKMRATRLVDYEETITLPEGFQVVDAPEARSLDTPRASLEFTFEHRGNTLTYRLRVALKDHMIPPEDYAGFREVMHTLTELRAARVLVTESAD